jgi:peptide/nickel transport system ATP-binding protein
MLSIKGLTVDFGRDRVLKGINLDVEAGESLAIIGESGAGKTTFGLSLMRLVEGDVKGRVLLDGVDLLSLSDEDMRRVRWKDVSMVFQNANGVLNPVHKVIDQVMEPMMAHGEKNRAEARDRAQQLLLSTGLPPRCFDAYPHQISGGEQQRVLIAMALSNDARLMVLDEPLSGLDAASTLEILGLLRRIKQERTFIVVTHDIATAAKLANKVAIMYAGRIMELGSTEQVLLRPRHPYTRALLRSYPSMTTVKDLQGVKGRMDRSISGCLFHPRCTQAKPICAREVPLLEKVDGRLLACHRGGIITMLAAEGMSKRYSKFQAVDSVSLSLDAGETLALVGQSGSGKTTLAKMIMGFVEADEGSLSLEEEKVGKREKDFYRRVQMIFQNPGEALSHRLTVLESVREPLEIQGIGTREERDRKARRVISEVELPSTEDFLDNYPHHLSGGEMQRVCIARALVLDPEVLIADEPTAFLDPSIQAKILKLLLNLQEQRGLTMLIITHDIAVARKVSDRIAVMSKGRIVEIGPSKDVLIAPQSEYTHTLIHAASALHSDESHEHDAIHRTEAPLHPGSNGVFDKGEVNRRHP